MYIRARLGFNIKLLLKKKNISEFQYRVRDKSTQSPTCDIRNVMKACCVVFIYLQ